MRHEIRTRTSSAKTIILQSYAVFYWRGDKINTLEKRCRYTLKSKVHLMQYSRFLNQIQRWTAEYMVSYIFSSGIIFFLWQSQIFAAV